MVSLEGQLDCQRERFTRLFGEMDREPARWRQKGWEVGLGVAAFVVERPSNKRNDANMPNGCMQAPPKDPYMYPLQRL
jgi:hypothetical protein